MTSEKTELDALVLKLGDSMNEFLLAKVNKERAELRFKQAQAVVSEVEDNIRAFKWGERELEPIKAL